MLPPIRHTPPRSRLLAALLWATPGVHRRRSARVQRNHLGARGERLNEQDCWMFLAGDYFDPLLSDVDELENRLRDLAQDIDLSACFEETLYLMNEATAYWLDSTGSYPDEAARICVAVRQRFDAILQESEFQDRRALAETIRHAIGNDTDATDTRLVASYVLALGAEGLQVLCDWLVALRREVVAAVPPLEGRERFELCSAQLPSARQQLYLLEIEARLMHSEYIANARQALLLAGLYQQVEHLGQTPEGYKVTEQLRSAIELAANSMRAQARGRGNRAPESVTQRAAAETRERIRAAAKRVMKSRGGISRKDLVSVLIGQQIASRPTIHKHLDALGILDDEK